MQFIDPLRGRIGCFQIIEDIGVDGLQNAYEDRFTRLRSCFELIQSADVETLPRRMLANYLWSMQCLAEEANLIARRMSKMAVVS